MAAFCTIRVTEFNDAALPIGASFFAPGGAAFQGVPIAVWVILHRISHHHPSFRESYDTQF
jgi:hypothetical protein